MIGNKGANNKKVDHAYDRLRLMVQKTRDGAGNIVLGRFFHKKKGDLVGRQG
jgi:hypothetical protein